MTRREWVAMKVAEIEAWKRRLHYREGALPWLLGGDWMYPCTFAWHWGKPVRHGPAAVLK